MTKTKSAFKEIIEKKTYSFGNIILLEFLGF